MTFFARFIAAAVVFGIASNVQAFPDDDATFLDQVKAYLTQEHYDLALSELQGMEAQEGGSPDYWSLVGYTSRRAGDFEASYAAYAKALEIDPAHIQARNYLGHLHLVAGDVDKARSELAFLVALCPSGCDERTDLEKSIALFEAGDLKNALKY